MSAKPSVGVAENADAQGCQDIAYHYVCDFEDLWQGEMAAHEVERTKFLLVHTDSGILRAVQMMCPHQKFPMSDGALEGDVLTCMKHLWRFNVVTGRGVNPRDTEIALYPVKVEDGKIYVSVAGIAPKFARP
jgi:toluene monooxygenase system ferredoxin subunit